MTTAIEVKEHPILFNGEMVRAILDGRKTQTRRVIKPQPPEGLYPEQCHWSKTGWALSDIIDGDTVGGCHCGDTVRCPYGHPGDQLWVRESVCVCTCCERCTEHIAYKAGDTLPPKSKWKPSIHMPRWASRIDLLVKSVRVERVQDITLPDVRAEATTEPQTSGRMLNLYRQFIMYWDSINAKRGFGWDVNPWVWVVEFERKEK